MLKPDEPRRPSQTRETKTTWERLMPRGAKIVFWLRFHGAGKRGTRRPARLGIALNSYGMGCCGRVWRQRRTSAIRCAPRASSPGRGKNYLAWLGLAWLGLAWLGSMMPLSPIIGVVFSECLMS